MGFSGKAYSYKHVEVANNNSRDWVYIWLEHARKRTKGIRGMDSQMMMFIRILIIVCFLSNLAFAATLHTVIDLQTALNNRNTSQMQITPASFKTVTMAELTEIQI